MSIRIRIYSCCVIIAALGGHTGAALGAQASSRVVAENAPKSISVWTHSQFASVEFVPLQESAKTFNRIQHAYKVELFPSSYKYDERVQNAAHSGTLPCLLEFDGPLLPALAWPGYLRPIDRFVPRPLLHDLLPSILAQGTYDGQLYGLGQFDSGLGLWANRRYLVAAGIRIPSIDAPWSLDEFEQAMAKLSILKGVEYALDLRLQLRASEFYSYAYGPILQGFGGDLMNRRNYLSAKGVLDGPRSVAAIKRIQYWIRQGWIRVEPDRIDDFAKGRAAMSWAGHWKYPDYRKALGANLILLPLPDLGQGIKTGIGSWNWGITSTCREPAGAWAFLSYLMSKNEILRITKVNGAVPARQSVLKHSSLYSNHGPLKIFAQQLRAGLGIPRPATPAYSIISKAFSQAVDNIIFAGGDAQVELSKAADIIDEHISTNRGYPVF